MQSVVCKILILYLSAESITAFRFVADLTNLDSSFLASDKRPKREILGGSRCAAGDGNHIAAARVTARFPYNNAKNGKRGNERGGYQVPARGDTAHEFRPPKSTDYRGPCPGLNTAANHGFLARDGIVTFNELLDAQQNVYNIGYDLANFLALLGLLLCGDPVTKKLSIGSDATSRTSFNPLITGRQSGLNGHNNFEGDTSLTRNDYFLANGDNYRFNGTLFKMMAESTGGVFNRDNIALYRYMRYQQSRRDNKSFVFGPLSVVHYGAASFLYELFPSGPNYIPDIATISSFFGAADNNDGTYGFKPERIPCNWTNRVQPFTSVDVVIEILGQYLEYPVQFGSATGNGEFKSVDSSGFKNGLFTPSPDIKRILCLFYQAIIVATPHFLTSVQGHVQQPLIDANKFIAEIVKNTGFDKLGCPIPPVTPN